MMRELVAYLNSVMYCIQFLLTALLFRWHCNLAGEILKMLYNIAPQFLLKQWTE